MLNNPLISVAEFSKCIFDVEIKEMVQQNVYLMARSVRNGDELIALLHQLGVITSEEKRTIVKFTLNISTKKYIL
jgi:hypothetical protein